jgi:hypothetical protein
MPKYGWFKVQGTHPSVEYEADYMEMDKEYVRLFKRAVVEPGSMNVTPRLVAAIRLDKSQDVREIK